MFHFLEKLLRTYVSRKCPTLYCILYGRTVSRKIKIVRIVLSFVLGYFLAFIMWKLIEINFDFSKFLKYMPLHQLFLLIIAIAFTLSRSVRSITLLIFVSLLGTSGRNYLRAMAFAFVIAGPIQNLATNGGEVARVFSCTTLLTYNLTKNRFDLMTKPFTKTLAHMRDDIDEIQVTFQHMQDILEPIRYEVEQVVVDDEKRDEDIEFEMIDYRKKGERKFPDASFVQKQFTTNMKNRCKMQLDHAKERCRRTFSLAQKECMEKFSAIVGPFLCWPYRIDIVCSVNVFGDPDRICDPREAIPKDFGDTYVQLLMAEDELTGNSTDIVLSYEIQNDTVMQHINTAKNTAASFSDEFQRRKYIFQCVMNFFENFLCLFILRLVIASIGYFTQYQSNVEFDNFYITEYFKKVDDRRKLNRKTFILPLKKHERSLYVDEDKPFSHTQEESKTALYHLLQLALEVITVGLFLLLDHIVINILEIVHEHSKITYIQQGEHNIIFHINGTGLMARILRTSLHNFNIHEKIYTTLSNEECLPQPSKLPQSFYIKLLLLYITIIVLICQSTALLRLRRVICSYFFYKREKRRILFLYNRLLRERSTGLDLMKQHAEQNLANNQVYENINFALRLRKKYPNRLGWLKSLKCARRKCLICEEQESDSRIVLCPNPECNVSYCHECGAELYSTCILCNAAMSKGK